MDYQKFYQEAKQDGYSDEEATNYLLDSDPSFEEFIKQSKDEGYTPEEIFGYLNTSSKPKEEGTVKKYGKEALRHGARTTSNILTRAVGLPGDILSLLNEHIASPIVERVTGEESVPYEKTIIGKTLPTTETHRRGLEEKTGKFLQPQNKIEHFVDDVIEDAALLFNPSQLVKKGAKPILEGTRKLAISLGANLAGEAGETITGSETAGGILKLGSLFLLSIVNPGRTVKEIGKIYNTAEKYLPADATTKSVNLEKNISNLENHITKGRPIENLSPAEKYVINQTSKVKNLIKDGKVNINQIWAQKRSLNEELASLYKEVPIHKDQKKVKNLAKTITSFLNSTIKEYGTKNPEFYKNFKNADEAFGTLARSNVLSNWVKNNVVHNPVTTGLMHLFTPISTGVAAGALPYQTGKLIYKIAKSPTLRKIYGSALKAAATEDAVTFNKYLTELDHSFEHEK